MKSFNPSFVLYAHKSQACPNKAAYVYLENNEDGIPSITFSLVRDAGEALYEVMDSATYPLDIDTFPKNFVTGAIKSVTALGNDECGLLFLLENEEEGRWTLRITTRTGFGMVDTEECEVVIPLKWLPF